MEFLQEQPEPDPNIPDMKPLCYVCGETDEEYFVVVGILAPDGMPVSKHVSVCLKCQGMAGGGMVEC